ncbi:MAG: winged helix-turn-helix transcriptional regulator [Saprospiraceae bacterium]|nr:winged helix-turn-helix transcriptional regulator [Saprospiraceae bacterium]
MDALKLGVELLARFENYLKEGHAPDLAMFGKWLSEQAFPKTMAPELPAGETLVSEIPKYLTYLNRYAKSYTKKLVDGTGIRSADEFVFLVYLLFEGSASKTTLIEVARLDKPSGMEVLNRLMAAGFIMQTDSQSDKRQKFMSLTETGRRKIHEILPAFERLSQLLLGDLTYHERVELHRLLKKLEDFHAPIRSKIQEMDWEELQKQVKKPESTSA